MLWLQIWREFVPFEEIFQSCFIILFWQSLPLFTNPKYFHAFFCIIYIHGPTHADWTKFTHTHSHISKDAQQGISVLALYLCTGCTDTYIVQDAPILSTESFKADASDKIVSND